MKQNKEVKISYWAAHLTTVVSVSLVLLLLGVIALVWLGADAETRRLKERIELSVVMADSVSDATAGKMAARITDEPYARNVKLITKAQALADWKRDTGEDLEELFGVNPLSPEVSFSVKSDYASARSIAKIRTRLSELPGVESVAAPDAAMVESMNANIGRLTLLLAIMAGVMVIVSFVLINNTVHLTIHSRRFTIHTMQLVGATNGFIRRPIVVNNLVSGLLAGLLAAGLLALALIGARSGGLPDLIGLIGWGAFGIVAAAMVLTGMALCSLAALVASTRFLRKDYDELFR
ncbi:MAG: permease-like cell division protein FtsX [Muribaculaceae bacterium]|nr:permease-like cell division protein FtsX [Muribaculaceae bacterium]